ncbi:hypothetical protein DL96DRAFT_1590016, partial [Flagelloscypha sp. PMI_526]
MKAVVRTLEHLTETPKALFAPVEDSYESMDPEDRHVPPKPGNKTHWQFPRDWPLPELPGFRRQFPVDIARIICELVARINLASARSLRLSCKTLRDCVTPFLFRQISIHNRMDILHFESALDIAIFIRRLTIYLAGWYGTRRQWMIEHDFGMAMKIFTHAETLELLHPFPVGQFDEQLEHLPLRPSIQKLYTDSSVDLMANCFKETSSITYLIFGGTNMGIIKRFQSLTHLLVFESNFTTFTFNSPENTSWRKFKPLLRACSPTLRLFLVILEQGFNPNPQLIPIDSINLVLGLTDDSFVVCAPGILDFDGIKFKKVILHSSCAGLTRASSHFEGLWTIATKFIERRKDKVLRKSILTRWREM